MTDRKVESLQRSISWIRIALPLSVAVLIGLQYLQTFAITAESTASSSLASQQWANHPPAFPLETLSGAVYAPLAASPLAAFDAGDGPWLGTSLWLQLGRLARSQDQLGYDYFASGRHVGLTAATFMQLAIPVLAVLLCWQLRDHIRESQFSTWATLLLHLIELCGPAITIGCLLTAVLSWRILGVDGAIRLILILAVYLLYSVAAGGICWFAFRHARDKSVAILSLSLFWLFNFTLARPATVNLAAAIYPLPTLDSFARKIDFETRSGYNGVESRRDRERRFVSEALLDYKAKSIDEIPVNLSAILLQKEERHQREVFVRRVGELRSQFDRQEQLEQYASLLMPYVGIQIASSALAATDFASEREQLAHADLYWDRIVKKVYDDVVQSSGIEGKKVLRGPDYWQQFPFIVPTLPSPAHSLASCLIPASGLTLWAAAGIMLVSLRRSPEVLAEEHS